MRNATRHIAALLSVLCAAFLVPNARGQSAHDLVDEGRGLLTEGRFEEATEKFNSAYREAPDEPGIDYAAGAAYLAQAEQLRDSETEKAKSAYENARAHFEKLSGTEDEAVRREAAFAAAHCRARTAELDAAPLAYLAMSEDEKRAVPADEFKKKVDLVRQAAAAYDAFVALYPEDPRGRQNAGRLRFLWKKMLQDLPKPKYNVMILNTSTDYPGAVAQPVPEQATVELRRDAQGGSGS